MGAGPGSWSAVLFLAPARGRGPRPLGARGGDALRYVGVKWLILKCGKKKRRITIKTHVKPLC